VDEDPLAELAPRDVVARAIWRRRQAGSEVYLDARKAIGERLPKRFPTVFARCAEVGIDPRVDLMPVTPAVHYHMGGIAVNLEGRSSLPGLWACGETASTGVHGANRLASNSLLEGLVYGAEAAGSIRRARPESPDGRVVWRQARSLASHYRSCRPEVDHEVRERLRHISWNSVGLVRAEASLASACEELSELTEQLGHSPWETGNMLLVARLVAESARRRRESRGAHHREDYPDRDPAWSQRSFWMAEDLISGQDPSSEGVRPIRLHHGDLAP
jgi:L-aspartate oxidase